MVHLQRKHITASFAFPKGIGLLFASFFIVIFASADLRLVARADRDPGSPAGQCLPNLSWENRPAEGWCLNNKISIEPPLPTILDPVWITISGDWCDSCYPKLQFQSITYKLIQIFAEANPPGIACAYVITPWQIKTEVGPLLMGNQTIEVHISRAGLPPFLNDSFDFTVVAGPVRSFYLPVLQK